MDRFTGNKVFVSPSSHLITRRGGEWGHLIFSQQTSSIRLTRNQVKRRVRLSIGKRLFCGQLLRRQLASSRRRWNTRYDSYPLAPYTGRDAPITFHNRTVGGSHREIESVRQFVAGLSFARRRQSLRLQTA
jgi:hypothetical protein